MHGFPRMDMTGQRYGRLVALYPMERGSNGMQWMFRCDCGTEHKAAGYHVRKGRITSCGCFLREIVKQPGGRRPNGYDRTPLAVRFWWHVEEAPADECWTWLGAKGKFGYGNVNTGKRKTERGRTAPAHRVAWELLRGPIPEGLTLDHECRNPSCVNPWHLDPVPQAVNTQRAMPFRRPNMDVECIRGHRWADGNLYVSPRGHRSCTECRRIDARARSARLKAAS